jgi:hypothetical protein
MGLFLVNGEYINEEATGMHRLVWNVLSCVAFILIWNSYPPTVARSIVWTARITGAVILFVLAFLYRANEGGDLHGFSTYWWGILGLIGWAYLVSGIVFTLFGNRLISTIVAWMFFHFLCMASHSGMITNDFLNIILAPINSGALPAITMGGVVTSMIYLKIRGKHQQWKLMAILGILSMILIAVGFYSRTFWDISKIRATPPWILICSGITMAVFIFIYWFADYKEKAHWFGFIKPAGTNTLVCYLIPHFVYAIVVATAVSFPDFMLTGIVGLLKSLLFALLVVSIAGWLGKRGVQIKL